MNKNLKVGLWFVGVPIVLILGYLTYQYFYGFQFDAAFHPKSMKKAFDVSPDGGGGVRVTDPLPQLLVGAGTCFMSICYGIAKIIRAIGEIK